MKKTNKNKQDQQQGEPLTQSPGMVELTEHDLEQAQGGAGDYFVKLGGIRGGGKKQIGVSDRSPWNLV